MRGELVQKPSLFSPKRIKFYDRNLHNKGGGGVTKFAIVLQKIAFYITICNAFYVYCLISKAGYTFF